MNKVIVINNELVATVPAEELIDTLIHFLQEQIYIPHVDNIIIMNESDWEHVHKPRLRI